MQEILIAGGGPAGAAAAIAACQEGSSVAVIERSASPRHKVCGEFISPGARVALEALDVWDDFAALGPHPIRRCRLRLGSRTNQWTLPERGWGLSRLQLDGLLLGKAAALGAAVRRGEVYETRREELAETRLIVASGRKPSTARGNRLFGFKAHFDGPSDDAVELFFDTAGYVGVSGIENRLTNVCGITQETVLQKYGFEFDELVRRSPPLAERLAPLRRRMRWLVVAPLSFSFPARSTSGDNVYAAGDALGFIDPFTGSGILNALLTGRLAGLAAARGISSAKHLLVCRSLLGRPFMVSSVVHHLVGLRGLHQLARYLPGQLLFQSTRPSLKSACEAARVLMSQ